MGFPQGDCPSSLFLSRGAGAARHPLTAQRPPSTGSICRAHACSSPFLFLLWQAQPTNRPALRAASPLSPWDFSRGDCPSSPLPFPRRKRSPSPAPPHNGRRFPGHPQTARPSGHCFFILLTRASPACQTMMPSAQSPSTDVFSRASPHSLLSRPRKKPIARRTGDGFCRLRRPIRWRDRCFRCGSRPRRRRRWRYGEREWCRWRSPGRTPCRTSGCP